MYYLDSTRWFRIYDKLHISDLYKFDSNDHVLKTNWWYRYNTFILTYESQNTCFDSWFNINLSAFDTFETNPLEWWVDSPGQPGKRLAQLEQPVRVESALNEFIISKNVSSVLLNFYFAICVRLRIQELISDIYIYEKHALRWTQG